MSESTVQNEPNIPNESRLFSSSRARLSSKFLRSIPPLSLFIRKIFNEFSSDECTTNAAALSYYTVFSLPPLMAVLIWALGKFVPAESISDSVQLNLSLKFGESVSRSVIPFLNNAQNPGATWTAAIIGLAGLLLGSLAMFMQLHSSMNRIWGVLADPQSNGLLLTILQRLAALLMVFGLGLTMLLAMLFEAITMQANIILASVLPASINRVALWGMQNLASLTLLIILLTALFKYVPDVKVKLLHAIYGAIFTALLFFLGKYALSYYLNEGALKTSYGKAGALALLMLWIYYSSLIIFLGAEFVQAWADLCGYPLIPDRRAVLVKREVVRE